MHIHISQKVITVSVGKIYQASSPHARRQFNRFVGIINQFSDGDWGHPELNARNMSLIVTNEVNKLIVGYYGNLVVFGLTCRPQLPETKVRILNPTIITYEEALQKPDIRAVLMLAKGPVVELMQG